MAELDVLSENFIAVNAPQFMQICESQNSLPDDQTTPSVLDEAMGVKRKLSGERSRLIQSKLLAIEQITCEERRVHEAIDRVNCQTQYIQKLLNALHDIDYRLSMTRSQKRRRRLQRN